MPTHPHRDRTAFLLLWGGLCVLKLWLAHRLPLFGDEAFYWWESTALDWAYSEIPAGTPWLIALGTAVGGDTALGVRWPFLLMGAAMPWLVVRIARRWSGDAVGWRAGLLALLLPLLGTMGVLALPDVPLTFATLVCLDAGAMLLRRVDARACAWLAFGLVLGALAHYRFPAVIAAGALGLALVPQGRALLTRPGVWIAVAIGALAWLPLLGWNLQHANAGLEFQLVERHPWRPQLKGLLLPLGQVLVVTPLLLLLLLATLWRAGRTWWRERDDVSGYVLGTALVPLAGFALLGVFADTERISFHWMLPGYLPLLALAPLLLARWPRGWRLATWGLAGAGLLAALAYLWIAASPPLRERAAGGHLPYPQNFSGWSEVADAVQRRLAAMPEGTRVVADQFMLAAQLEFALGRPGVAVLEHPFNHKHGRAAQLAVWGAITLPRDPHRHSLLVVGEGATPPREWLAWYHEVCRRAGGLSVAEVVGADRGELRFALFELAPGDAVSVDVGDCVLPALSWLDDFEDGVVIDRRHRLTGWAFKDGAGIERIEVLVDGEVVGEAAYGLPAPHVGSFWGISTDPAHPDVGLAFALDLPPQASGWRWIGLRVHGRDGRVEDQRQVRARVIDRP